MQISDASNEFERLRLEQETYLSEKKQKKIGGKEKMTLPSIPKFHLPGKATAPKEKDYVELIDVIDTE